MKIFKVLCDGNWCAFSKLSDALELICTEVEASVDSLEVGDCSYSFSVEVDEMTQKEFDELPEFEGF